MERVERIKRRDGIEPVALPALTPREREQQREERESRRRDARRPDGPAAADSRVGPEPSGPGGAPPRLDVRA